MKIFRQELEIQTQGAQVVLDLVDETASQLGQLRVRFVRHS